MHRAEIGKMIELAYTVLAQRAEQVLNGKATWEYCDRLCSLM